MFAFRFALRLTLLAAGLTGPAPGQAPEFRVPQAGQSFVDPSTGNRVWRVTDENLCPGGGKHFYSYWPVWNADGAYLLVRCEGWSRRGSNALLIRDSDLKVQGDALRGAPDLDVGRLFWSWTDPRAFYGYRGQEVWRWDPFRRKGQRVFRLDELRVGEKLVQSVRLAYVSFDDRYLLLEMQAQGVIGLAVYDLVDHKIVGLLDLSTFSNYDEAVFTRDNQVWVAASTKGQQHSYRYSRDFAARVRVSEAGHHAHGLLPDNTPVAVRAASNRNCLPGSRSGNPRDPQYPTDAWKPTAVILDERVDTARRADGSSTGRDDPLRSILFQIGCAVPGRHNFDHFSWNNRQRDTFFISTWTYGPAQDDPLANAILRVRLRFDSGGRIVGDDIDVLARHGSHEKMGYWAQPRVSCNQQGTRCLFASSMAVPANKERVPQLYIVDVPAK